MKKPRFLLLITLLPVFLSPCTNLFSQFRGLRSITEKELRYHLEFLAAPEFRGRETPSPELEIATLYLGNWSKYNDLKPLLKDGSFYQSVPGNVIKVNQPNTMVRLTKIDGERIFHYGRGFSGNFSVNGAYSGNVVFAGTGISDPVSGWDDLKDLDLRGKVVLILDEQIPGTVFPYYQRLNQRAAAIRNRGASALFTVITPERNSRGDSAFERMPSGIREIVFDSQRTSFTQAADPSSSYAARPYLPFGQAEISHDLASEILGVSKNEISEMFYSIRKGTQVASKVLQGVRVSLEVEVESYKSASRNVIAVVEGSDPVLKNEYVVVSGHHDHIGMREGEVIPGADDNGTATVALLEIAQALLIERPKRSVIIAWFTAEEKGLLGSHFFVNNCPVPVEKISACLNMDLIGSNNPDSLFLVGPDLLSSELDAAINKVNKEFKINFGFDYRYSDLNHPQSVYFRSDHYPFVRFGIPSLWFFSGFTPVYHTPKDVVELIDFSKFLKAVKLVYLTAFETGNMKNLLKLDVNPAVTSRGKHNVREKSLFQAPGK
jgi:hypothetical protein